MKKAICILISIGLVISFTSCSSKEVSTLNKQSQTSNKIITSNAPKQTEPNKAKDISTDSKINLIKTDFYIISIPADISVKKELDGKVLDFSINGKVIGGLQVVGYYPDKTKSPFGPNHSLLVSSNKIKDMNYEVLENKYEMYLPAASGDTTKTNVTHLFFLLKDYAYDLYFDTSAVKDTTILEIGKSFKLN
jgi:hypothetical protein